MQTELKEIWKSGSNKSRFVNTDGRTQSQLFLFISFFFYFCLVFCVIIVLLEKPNQGLGLQISLWLEAYVEHHDLNLL